MVPIWIDSDHHKTLQMIGHDHNCADVDVWKAVWQ